MDHLFSITTFVRQDRHGRQLRSGIMPVMAETELGPSPQTEFPELITGKFIGLTPQLFRQFKHGHDVEAGFEGKPYKFSRLEEDGGFELKKDS